MNTCRYCEQFDRCGEYDNGFCKSKTASVSLLHKGKPFPTTVYFGCIHFEEKPRVHECETVKKDPCISIVKRGDFWQMIVDVEIEEKTDLLFLHIKRCPWCPETLSD